MPTTFRHDMPFGARVLEDGKGVRFRLYAPTAERVLVRYGSDAEERSAMLESKGGGWFENVFPDAAAGTRYQFEIGDLVVPDPASRWQPQGVHGPSVVIDPAAFVWPDDGWTGRPWNETVFYELHVGTFTAAGTYAAAREKLAHVAALGATAIELMPLADVPGTRNWGYDGVLPYAPSHNYGTPDELKAFVAAAHAAGLAVYLDVVYNHFGPEGNYLHAYAPTFYTDRHVTPWGAAIDVEADDRSDVRAYFIENALYWLQEYRFDGLRFDAVHAIEDGPNRRFLRELAAAIHARVDRPVHLVLENEDNEAGLLGDGLYRAQWADDAHNSAHVAITGQIDGYYSDFTNDPIAMLGRTLTQGFAYQGEPSALRGGKSRGFASAHLPLRSFVTFVQNHDQVGNRPFGDRITSVAPDAAVRAAVAIFLLAPPPPLLFMGEEWGASTPFLFFCDFEPDLAKLVTQGRRNEFAAFAAFADPHARERIPDPSALETFEHSKLNWDEIATQPHAAWLAFYRNLLAIRRAEIAPRTDDARGADASFERAGAFGLRARWRLGDRMLRLETNLGSQAASGFAPLPDGNVLFSTHDPTFADGVAPPWSVRWTLA